MDNCDCMNCIIRNIIIDSYTQNPKSFAQVVNGKIVKSSQLAYEERLAKCAPCIKNK